MKKKHIILLAIALFLVAGLIWLIWGNVTVGLTEYSLQEENLPADFDGYRIAHVSDLHNSRLWKKAIRQLKAAQPDIICITGDMVDANHTDVDVALNFAAEAVKIAPCYYIPGNHEHMLADGVYQQLIQDLAAIGVTVLHDASVQLSCGDGQICLSGLGWDHTAAADFPAYDGYHLLLAHHPEFFHMYADTAVFDLVLSGHAHGGQFQLPFIGGLVAPGQGLLPEYDSGVYTVGNTDMVVSRGIGNSVIPVRFYNRPEVILIELRCA